MVLKNLVVKKSKMGGFGCFAKKSFKKGELIIDAPPGRIVHRKDAKYITPKSERWDYYNKDNYYFMGDPEYYINHSCNSAVYIKNRKIYANRNVKKGEEITFDYAINGIDSWKLKCRRGSKNCRKIVDGRFFKLPLKIQKKYLPYLDTWFKKSFAKKLKSIEK